MPPKKSKEDNAERVSTENVDKLIDLINNKFKKKIASTLSESSNTQVERFVSTGSTILDIAILRGRSSKFDVISIYPSSGTVVHHVYTDADKAPSSATSGIITVNSQKYFRFGVFDDISSYRD